MKIEFDGKSDVEIINLNIKDNIVSNVIMSLIFVSSFGLVRYIEEPYKFLLISPSFYNYEYLNWVSSAWIGFLGIHGTIAALSITFMGMFVGQASSFSEHGFESLSKAHLLRRYNFLEFSILSVCNLLCGIFLMLVGCGLIAYFISAFMSLYFIIQYGVMYFKLYNLNENPGLIKGHLFEAIKETGQGYNFLNEGKDKLTLAFENYCKRYDFFSSSQTLYYWNEDSIDLTIFPEAKNVIVNGFRTEILEEVANLLHSFDKDSCPTICFYFSFLTPSSNYSIKIYTPAESPLTEDKKLAIQNLLTQALLINDVPYIYDLYKQFEDALVNNIRNSLLNGDEWSLDFGVKAFYDLTSSRNYMDTLRNLDFSIAQSNKKDVVNPSLLASFLDKMFKEALARNDVHKSVGILSSFFSLARYIYSKNAYYEFYKLAFPLVEHKVKYGADESDFAFIDFYKSIVLNNLVNGDYEAFEIDTTFLTKGMKYLDLNNAADHESLNETQRKFLGCLFEVITLLIVRAEYLLKKNQPENDELAILKESLIAWLNAKFLEELYYKNESYDVLFSIPKKYSVFHPEFQLREVPAGEVSSHSISNDTYKMIALFLTQTPFNNNKFDLIFLKDVKSIKDSNFITTHNLESILAYLESDSFDVLLNMINSSSGEAVASNIKAVSDKIKVMISELNSLILRDVISAELNDELVQEYINKLELSFRKQFELIVPKDESLTSKEIELDASEHKFLINKREVLPPIDGVTYGMNISNLSRSLIHRWVISALYLLSDVNRQLVEINAVEELTSRNLISVTYKAKGEVSTYRHTRGLKIADDEGYLQLGQPGIYYLNLNKSFFIEQADNLIDVDVKKVDEQAVGEINELMRFRNDNPYLYSILKVKINVSAVPKPIVNLYFISIEQCLRNNEKLERDVGQLFNKSQANLNDGSVT